MQRIIVIVLVFIVFCLEYIEALAANEIQTNVGGRRIRRHHCPRTKLWTNMLRSCHVDENCREDECCCEIPGIGGQYCLPEEMGDKDEDDSEKDSHNELDNKKSGNDKLYKEEEENANDCHKKSWDKMKKCRQIFIGRVVFGVTVTISVTLLTGILILCIAKKVCRKKHIVSSTTVNLKIGKLPKHSNEIKVQQNAGPGQTEISATKKSLKELEANETWAQRVMSFPEDLPPVYTPAVPPKYTNAPPPSYHI